MVGTLVGALLTINQEALFLFVRLHLLEYVRRASVLIYRVTRTVLFQTAGFDTARGRLAISGGFLLLLRSDARMLWRRWSRLCLSIACAVNR